MATIVLSKWREGFQKISLTKLQAELLHLSLSEAKANVDRLLDNQVLVLRIPDEATALEFFRRATIIGVGGRFVAPYSANLFIDDITHTPLQLPEWFG